jgi:dihydroorotase
MALVLQGGRVLDPLGGVDAVQDVRIEHGQIAAIGPGVATDGADVRQLHGAVVTPGLIDSHVHVYEGVGFGGIDPDIVGVGSGVSTVVDAGSSGASTFEGLRRYVIGRARTRVLVFLNLSLVGTPAGPSSHELAAADDVDEDAAQEVIEANRDLVVGIKVRASRTALGQQGLTPLRRGRALADRVHLPLMIHIGDPHAGDAQPVRIVDVVDILRPGDILTHLFTGQPGGLLDANGRLHDAVRAAHAAGLRFDVGHGVYNLSFETAARVLDQGLQPHTISTDVHRFARDRLVYDLPTTMAKCLALGFTLPQVVEKATYEAGRSLGNPALVPGLAVGQLADVSVFRVEEADWQAEDSMGQQLTAHHRIVPLLTVRGDEIFDAVPSTRP